MFNPSLTPPSSKVDPKDYTAPLKDVSQVGNDLSLGETPEVESEDLPEVPSQPKDVNQATTTVRFDGNVASLTFAEAPQTLSLTEGSAKLQGFQDQVPTAVSLHGDSVVFSFPKPGNDGGLEHVKMRVADLNACLTGSTEAGKANPINGRQSMPVMALRVVKDIMGMPDVSPSVSRRIVADFVKGIQGPPDPSGQKLVQARNHAFTALVAAIRLGPNPTAQLEQDKTTVANARPPLMLSVRQQFDTLIAKRTEALDKHDFAGALDAQDAMVALANQHNLAPMGAAPVDLSVPKPDAFPIADDPQVVVPPPPPPLPDSVPPQPQPPKQPLPPDLPPTQLPSLEAWIQQSTPPKSFFRTEGKRSNELQQIDQIVRQLASARDALSSLPKDVTATTVKQQQDMVHDLTTSLLRTIEAWDGAKKAKFGRGGVNTNPRAAAVQDLYQKAKADFQALNGPALQSLPENRTKWGGPESGFTKPTEHTSGKFQYIINGLTQDNHHSALTQLNPDRYNTNPGIISTSLINHEKNTVWAYSGYILEPDTTSLYSFKPADQGIVAMGGKDHLHTLAGKNGLPTPSDALKSSPVNQHNELSVVSEGWQADPGSHPPIKITGIYVLEDDDHAKTPKRLPELLKDKAGNPIQVGGKHVYQMKSSLPKAWMDNFKQVSEERNIPIVYIKQSEGAMAKEPVAWAWPVALTQKDQYVDFASLSQEEQSQITGNLHESTPLVPQPSSHLSESVI